MKKEESFESLGESDYEEEGEFETSNQYDIEQIAKDSIEHLSPKINRIVLESHVFMELLNSFREKGVVTGVLCGLNQGSDLEITYSFPLPKPKSAPGVSSKDKAQKIRTNQQQRKMLSALQQFRNLDNNLVGWYRTSYFDSFVNLETVRQHYVHHKMYGDKSIMLILDQHKSQKGLISLKAYRLSETFLQFLRDHHANSSKKEEVKPSNMNSQLNKISKEILNDGLPSSVDKGFFTLENLSQAGLTPSKIFEEVPLIIRKSEIIENFLGKLVKEERDNINLFKPLLRKEDKLIENRTQTILSNMKEFSGIFYQMKNKKTGGTNFGQSTNMSEMELLLLANQIQKNTSELGSYGSSELVSSILERDIIKSQ